MRSKHKKVEKSDIKANISKQISLLDVNDDRHVKVNPSFHLENLLAF